MSDDMAVAGSIERFTIETSDGITLEAEYTPSTPARVSVVICHPHPLYGGSMQANVVQALFQSLPASGASVLRFNFRGSGASTGTHDKGIAERLDVAAALAEVVRREPNLPVILAGYSFGADVALSCDHPAIAGWFAVAPPLRIVPLDEMSSLNDPRPVRVVTGTQDQYCPPGDASERLANATATTVSGIEGADHFFAVGLSEIVAAAKEALG